MARSARAGLSLVIFVGVDWHNVCQKALESMDSSRSVSRAVVYGTSI